MGVAVLVIYAVDCVKDDETSGMGEVDGESVDERASPSEEKEEVGEIVGVQVGVTVREGEGVGDREVEGVGVREAEGEVVTAVRDSQDPLIITLSTRTVDPV